MMPPGTEDWLVVVLLGAVIVSPVRFTALEEAAVLREAVEVSVVGILAL